MKKHLRYLFLIFVAGLAFNLFLSLTSSNFNGDTSYYNLRVFEHIKETGKPIYYDELSYSGRYFVSPILFYYLFAVISFLPVLLKIIPAVLLSFIPIIVYFISREMANDERNSLLTSLLSSIIPIYSIVLANQVTVYSLVFPMTAMMMLCFIKIDNKRYFNLFIVLSFILPIIHSSSFILILIFTFYILLMSSENIKIAQKKIELIIFSFFLILLINMLFFKKALLEHGFGFIRSNIPQLLTDGYFQNFDIFSWFYVVGIIPLIFGIWGLYRGLRTRKESVIFVSSLLLGISLLLLLKFIEFNTGLLFLSLGLVLLSSLGIKGLFEYIKKTKLSRFSRLFVFVFVLLFGLLSIFPSYTAYENKFQDLSDFEWMEENIKPNSVMVAPVGYGHVLSYHGFRNVADTNFLLAPDTNQRIEDIRQIYITWSRNKAASLLDDYKVDYIYINEDIKNTYKIEDLKYLEDGDCIGRIKETVYAVNC